MFLVPISLKVFSDRNAAVSLNPEFYNSVVTLGEIRIRIPEELF